MTVQLSMIGESAVTTMNNTGHEFALNIGIGHALALDDTLCRSRHERPCGIQRQLNLGHLIQCDRRTGIAFDAAGTSASLEVAAEKLREEVGGKQHAADFKYGNLFHGLSTFLLPNNWRLPVLRQIVVAKLEVMVAKETPVGR